MDLKQKIDRIIEEEIMKNGKMGTETVRVSIVISNEEINQFKLTDLYDNAHYYWEIEKSDEGAILYISYTEEV